jgi:hypothetical protein
MKEYSIKEALIELNISRATLYNRLKLQEKNLKDHINIKDGKKYISSIGIKILKNNDSIDESKEVDKDNFELNKENDFLKSQIEFLQSQLEKKDEQIETLSKLVENSQVLLKNEQKAKLIEAPVKKSTFTDWFKKKK